jgi:hypothetical protein
VSVPRLIHATDGLTTTAGAPLTLTLTLDAGQDLTSIEIHRLEVLPHKKLRTTVLSVRAATDGVASLAKAMTTVAHELDRLHRRGYCHPEGHAVHSWPTTPKRPHAIAGPLAAALAGLDVPVAQDRPVDRGEALEILMREHSTDLVREHETNSYLAADPLSSADELLDHQDLLGSDADQ